MEEKALNKKYTQFIKNLTEQVSGVLPSDINKLQEDYLISNIRHSATLLAKSMQEDDVFKKLDFDKQF